jgi:predicted  nucleic acid-binding Zn-ribbon protein
MSQQVSTTRAPSPNQTTMHSSAASTNMNVTTSIAKVETKITGVEEAFTSLKSQQDLLKTDLSALEREIAHIKASYATRLKQLMADFQESSVQLQKLVKI